jgi:hypothetical protein
LQLSLFAIRSGSNQPLDGPGRLGHHFVGGFAVTGLGGLTYAMTDVFVEETHRNSS